MIVFFMKSMKLFIAETGDVLWIAPGIKSIGIVREKALKRVLGKDIVGRRIGALSSH